MSTLVEWRKRSGERPLTKQQIEDSQILGDCLERIRRQVDRWHPPQLAYCSCGVVCIEWFHGTRSLRIEGTADNVVMKWHNITDRAKDSQFASYHGFHALEMICPVWDSFLWGPE